ncbi:hypothetical protein KIPB_013268, partial [Kipferlia bialata]|eukprot:g13268.t1
MMHSQCKLDKQHLASIRDPALALVKGLAQVIEGGVQRPVSRAVGQSITSLVSVEQAHPETKKALTRLSALMVEIQANMDR